MQEWNVGDYEKFHQFVWQKAQDLVDEWLVPQESERILDLGCGTGHLTARIASCGAEVVGIDGSQKMIDQACKNYPAICFIVADARSWRIEHPFDAVFSNAALHWIREADAVVKTISFVLKPGGRFIAEFGGRGNIYALHAALDTALQSVGCVFPVNEHPWYFPSLEEYSTLLAKHGFTVKQGQLFDRMTALEEGEQGLRLWIQTFGEDFLKRLPPEQEEAFYQEAERVARPVLFKDGHWWADYRRLRVKAVKAVD